MSVNQVIIGSDNHGTKPLSKPVLGYCQLDPKNFGGILIKIQNFSFTKMKISSAERRPFCPGGDELTDWALGDVVILKL